MNPTAIYSKSGKGVQEASGKTSLLKRPDRAVLAAIDGRATLADVASKVGKDFDPGFQQLITQLDKDGFIREVSVGSSSAKAAAPAARAAAPAARPAAKPAAPADPASDLDFSSLGIPSKPAAPPPPAPPKADPAAQARAKEQAKEQESALYKARQEAEAKALADRDRVRLEAEARMRDESAIRLRAETEARMKAEAEAKVKAEAEEKIKAARDAALRTAAEAKAKAEAEAKRARDEAERKARAEVERVRREAEEEARKAREEAEQARREAEEERRRLEAERKRDEEERAARRKREDEEEEARRKRREEEEQREEEERAARRRQRDEEEEQERQVRAEDKAEEKPKEEEAKPRGGIGGFADSLLADLASFTKRDDDELKEKQEAVRKEKEAKEAAARQAREEADRREKDEAENRTQEEEKRRRKEEEAQRKREEEEALRAREEQEKARLREEEERRKQEAEERARKAKEEERLVARAEKRSRGDYDDGKRAEQALKRGRRGVAEPSKVRRPRKWGKPVAITLALILLVALAVAHVMPIKTDDYERAATEALGRPVKISSGRLWLLSGLQVRLEGVTLGEGISIESVHASPEITSLYEPKKFFSRIELEGLKMPQQALGEALFARVKSASFGVSRIIARDIQLEGPLILPKGLEADLSLAADGSVRAATIRGAEQLQARLAPKGAAIDFEMSAGAFTLPIAPELSFSQFSMKGTATRQGMNITEWDGALLNGTVSGSANVRWGGTWNVDGIITARGINAAVFAPALLSEGRGEGTGRFSMAGTEPAKLGGTGRLEGNFTVNRGVLGSFDLSQAIRTGGRNVQGRTQFTEMHGQAVYDRGAVTLRNITIGAGAMNAGASADITQGGALSGRIVADVRTTQQTLRATLNLGGTVKEPQVRN